MRQLEGLKPEAVFRYFEELSQIPRGSGHTEACAAYLENFAKERGLRCDADARGNITIFKDASKGHEGAAPVILQGHMDMVCVKTALSNHDFGKDPLALQVEGDDLFAKDTSLGGDDGIAVAYMLAILDDPGLIHPPLECLITTDEEIGLLGAAAYDASALASHTMINLDSEAEGIFTCGCAGGSVIESAFPVNRITVTGLKLSVTVTGLSGGHSGAQIGLGRANSNKLAGRFLAGLDGITTWSLESVSGGTRDNVIPGHTEIRLVIDEEDLGAVKQYAEDFERELRSEYRLIDEGIRIITDPGITARARVFDLESQDRMTACLLAAPSGVRKMCAEPAGVVETSSNAAIVETEEDRFVITISVRSMLGSARAALEAEILSLTAFAGGTARIYGSYPGWEFRADSPLRDAMTEVYRELYGEDPSVEVIHAGLECGLFASKIPDLDAVSIGPDMKEIHSVNEKLSISSTERVWNFLLRLLERLAS
ncbi:MAG: aminoacyl-histidine dipeptidase [Lachnospiraceae bacterium]|nr:aminoacyl-histidine dipeptidase [Lachnospiraceae bacterium]